MASDQNDATPLSVSIDRASPVPLYHQLAEQLTAAITDGRLQPGDPFENELAMTARLGLSRPTVRRAIQQLVDAGLLIRRRGLGTTVAAAAVHRKVALTSLFDDLERAGRTPRTSVLELELGEFPSAAAALGLPADTPLLAVTRLRLAGELPLAVLHNWLPASLPDISREELESKGLYAVLREHGIRPVVAHQSIGARMPTSRERRLLGLRGTQPVLTMRRVAFDSAGQPVELGEHSYRAQDYSFELMVDER
ncbi:MAG: GntR family transcriptional regulator [Micrococcales bacterium]|nr:GntR family transcriptional regulator [Micrococcales bacterium]